MNSPFSLFKEVPLSFFRPLSGKFAPLYWAVLHRLYELDFEGEPFEITQELAIEQSAQLIEQLPEFSAGPEQFVSNLELDLADESTSENSPTPDSMEGDERTARQLARMLLKRLERCGWFDYEYRESHKGYVLAFRDYAARMIHTMSQIAKREQPVFEGLAQSIKAALTPSELDEKPGVALYNAQKATKDLVREIKILSRNIHRYADRALKEAQTPKALLELQLDIYQSKVIDASYHRFKTTDNIFKYRSYIMKQLQSLQDNPLQSASAIQWISRNQSIGYEDANSIADEWTELIRAQMASIHLLTDDLDRKNARYIATTLQKISYLLNQERDLEGKLVRALKIIDSISEQELLSIPSSFACYEIGWFDPQSLYVKPKDRVALEPVELNKPAMTAELKEKLFGKVRDALDRQFSRKSVYALARSLFSERDRTSIEDLELENEENLSRLVFLTAHSKDRGAPYEFRRLPSKQDQLIVRGPNNRFRVRPGHFYWKGN